MSTPLRVPLREIRRNGGTPRGRSCSSSTTLRSPGPALLLGINLSAKSKLLRNSPMHEEENEESNKTKNDSADVARFRQILSSEMKRITDLCEKWDDLLNMKENENGPSDAIMGDVRATIGQGRLVMHERFHQFEGLIDNCEFGTSEKPVTCQDLQGFWEMIFYQVEDVNAKFDMLEKCKLCNWDPSVLCSLPSELNANMKFPKKRGIKAKPAKSSLVKRRNEALAKKRAEARKRLAAAKAEMKRAHQESNVDKTQCETKVTFDAGFFKIDSPLKSSPAVVSIRSQSQTPQGVSSRKQVYAPRRITESSSTVTASSGSCLNGAVCPETAEGDISKELVVLSSTDKTDCIVEILLSDDEQVTASSPLQMTVPFMDYQKSPDSRPVMKDIQLEKQLLSPALKEAYAMGSCFNVISEMPSPIVLSDAACKNCRDARSPDVDNSKVERTCTFFDGSSYSLENVRAAIDSSRSLDDIPEANSMERPKLSECAEVIQDLDTSSASKLINDAEIRIRRASEILAQTPRSDFSDLHNSAERAVRETADVCTSFTPKCGSFALLYEQLQTMASHFEKIHVGLSPADHQKIRQLEETVKKQSSDITLLKSENSKLEKALEAEKASSYTVQNLMENLMENGESDVRGDTPPSDILYRPHYIRLLAQVKVLKVELASFQRIKPELAALKEKLGWKVEKLKEDSRSLNMLNERLDHREAELNEAAQIENKHLVESRKTIEELESRLIDATTELQACKQKSGEQESMLCSLLAELESVKAEKDLCQCNITQLKRENSDLSSMAESLNINLQDVTKMHAEEHVRAEALQDKMDRISEEVSTAFKEFSSNIEIQGEIVSRQQKQIDELTDANTELKQDSQSLKDLIETLKYVEDEKNSLEDQLKETEQSLKDSQFRESQKDATIGKLKVEIDASAEETRKNKAKCEKLQEELDVVKVDTLVIVRQKEEELIYGGSGMSQVLHMMESLHARLREMNSSEQKRDANGYGGDDVYQCHGKLSVIGAACANGPMNSDFLTDFTDQESLALESDMPTVRKDEDYISWKVDRGVKILQSIIEACAAVHLRFHKEIEKLEFQNSVLRKQLMVSNEKLASNKKHESELEIFMRKRVEELTKKNDEKASKLLKKSRMMEELSDQNMELTEYKFKYEELANEFNVARKGRQAKRRSSSAGTLKCRSNVCL